MANRSGSSECRQKEAINTAVRDDGVMIKIIWFAATVYFMGRLVKRLLSSMKDINDDVAAENAVIDVDTLD